jgi:hypothetical protein
VKNVTAAAPAQCEAGGVANRNLYEVLETVPNASAETIESQYRVLMERLAGRTNRGHATELERMALEEAHRTLINPELRRRYDARITAAPAVHPSMEAPESWLARNRRILLLFVLFAVCAWGYHQKTLQEQAAEARAQREREAIAARKVIAAPAAPVQEQASAGDTAARAAPAPAASAPAAPPAEAKPGG